jgi:prevent-host-death family protein
MDQFRREIAMREVPASAAKTHLARLLDAVERGETIAITRHGRRVARIVPEIERRRAEIEAAIADMRELAKENGPASIDEILQWVREGRKY